MALRPNVPGVLLGATLGLATFAVCRVLPSSLPLSHVLLALLAGALIVNTPLGRAIGLAGPGHPGPDRYDAGLRFLSTWVLRAAIVLSGLQVHASFLVDDQLPLILAVMVAALPSAWLVAHALGAALGLDRALTDLVVAGLTLGGPTATNAITPLVDARREEQGIALATAAVCTMLGVVAVPALASASGLDAGRAELWNGLSVNDLSSALSAGHQVDGDVGAVAATARSARMLVLAPALLFFHALGARRAAERGQGANAATAPRARRRLLPGFILGFVALATLRAVGDVRWGSLPWWWEWLDGSDRLMNVLVLVVSAALGLRLEARRFSPVARRALLVSGAVSSWVAVLAFALIEATRRQHPFVAAVVGAGGLASSFFLYRACAVTRATEEAPGVASQRGEQVETPGEAESSSTAWSRARVALHYLLVAALLVAPLPIAGRKVASLLRRHMHADRPMPAPALPERAASLRRTVYDPHCPPGMTLIVGGRFKMGSNDGFKPDELPIHDVDIKDFCLDITEITVAEYLECAAVHRCTPVNNTVAHPGLSDRDAELWDGFCNGNRADRMDHPINCVDFTQARGYCAAQGSRLPTESEWEYAARGGSEQRKYPWGDEPAKPGRANVCGWECAEVVASLIRVWGPLYDGRDAWPTTAPVGTFPDGDGRWGTKDLLGNVTEWLESNYCPYPNKTCASAERCARGNGYLANLPLKIRNARRNHDVPWHRSSDAGMRCARDPLP